MSLVQQKVQLQKNIFLAVTKSIFLHYCMNQLNAIHNYNNIFTILLRLSSYGKQKLTHAEAVLRRNLLQRVRISAYIRE